jgi:hypothetical protein
MFNLEQAIAAWLDQMLAAGIKFPVPLDELELHLREEIEQQIKAGLNEQTAFETSVKQIGLAFVLKQEFEKFDGIKTPALQGLNHFYSATALICGATLLVLLWACPPVSKINGSAYFTYYTHPDDQFSDFFYDVDFGALSDEGQRIDVPVWFVDLSLLVASVGAGVLAFRRAHKLKITANS